MNIIKSQLILCIGLAFASPAFGQTADKSQFKAHVNLMPGPAPNNKLIVTGIINCPTPGWKEKLVEAKPPGINPSILILDVESVKPSGMAAQVITPVQVRFEKEAGKQFKQVTVRGAGPEFTIDVEEVH